MANLPESSTFDAGVYQIETTDPVIGGPSGVTNTPLKNLANRTKYLKDQVDSLASTKAPLASPAFTGTPTVPTAAAGTNTTQVASTAFVSAAVSAASPDLSPYAPKDSPVFSGNPVAPTPAQFDNDTSLATTEFVQRALGNLSGIASVSASGTLSAADVGKAIHLGGAGGTVTLPATGTIPIGSLYNIVSINAAWTISPNTGQNIYNGKNIVANVSCMQGGTAQLYYQGNGYWIVISGSVAIGKTPEFAFSFAGSGYQKLPSGLIIQWARSQTFNVTGPSTGADFSYPISFPNACVSTILCLKGNTVSVSTFLANANGDTLSKYQAYWYGSGSGQIKFDMFAVGY